MSDTSLIGAELMMPGGIQYEGRENDDRTDVSTVLSAGGDGWPAAVTVHITTGNSTIAVCGIVPDDLERLGRFLVERAREYRDSLEGRAS